MQHVPLSLHGRKGLQIDMEQTNIELHLLHQLSSQILTEQIGTSQYRSKYMQLQRQALYCQRKKTQENGTMMRYRKETDRET
jgi:hypothetical protein